MIDRKILEGIVDVHVHCGPSLANRFLDAGEMAQAAAEAGYKAFIVKDHYQPTIMTATMAEKYHGSGKVQVFGGLALNNSVGVFNLKAVDVAIAMGAKMIWFPTISAAHHIKYESEGFPGSGKLSTPEVPVHYTDGQGHMTDESLAVLQMLKHHPQVTLATGHGCFEEVDTLVQTALCMNVKNVFVNHPHYLIGATNDDCIRWARMGAYIELDACCTAGITDEGTIPLETYRRLLSEAPLDRLVISSDFGQMANGSPVDGMYKFIVALMDQLGVTEEQINMMAKTNPARMLSMD